MTNVINSKGSWNIRCTESLPVSISIDGGENLQNNTRRMKNSSSLIIYLTNCITLAVYPMNIL
ncbi:hypothetical protein BANRA_00314 [Acinetobacter baumannii]|nr:hypothetical protein BANRA_00314 [Acinetobacter baumannii]